MATIIAIKLRQPMGVSDVGYKFLAEVDIIDVSDAESQQVHDVYNTDCADHIITRTPRMVAHYTNAALDEITVFTDNLELLMLSDADKEKLRVAAERIFTAMEGSNN
jgi:hypothetical protein